jgi:hypothetical protein
MLRHSSVATAAYTTGLMRCRYTTRPRRFSSGAWASNTTDSNTAFTGKKPVVLHQMNQRPPPWVRLMSDILAAGKWLERQTFQ